MIDPTTSVQYSGYFQKQVRDSYEAGKINLDSEEVRVQGILEAERKRVQPIAHSTGKKVERQRLEKNVKERGVEFRDMGKIVNLLA